MKIRILSDIHTEFTRDYGRRFFQELPEGDEDVVVCAGDLSNLMGLGPSLGELCERFKGKEVLFVPGNHDYWHPAGVNAQERFGDTILEAERAHGNLITMTATAALIGGREWFFGATLWHQGRPMRVDANNIGKGAAEMISEGSKQAIDLLDRHKEMDAVVITHHLPHVACVAPRWRNEDNGQFLNYAAEEIVARGKYKLWIFGHTHESVDVTINGTRCVANPYGYYGCETNPNFNPSLVIEV